MKNLFVTVGISSVGKSTTIREFCEEDYSFEYFKNDRICRRIFALFGVKRFSIAHAKKWAKLGKLGDTVAASYWLHEAIFHRVQGDTVFAEGFRYYFEDERLALS